MMGQADLARLGHDPAADEARVGNGVVRRPEGPRPDRSRTRQQPGRAVDARHLEHLVVGHVGENGRQPPGEHRLARPGGSDEEDVVRARRGDFEGPLDVLLALDVFEVDRIDSRSDELALVEAAGNDLPRLAKQSDDAHDVVEGIDLDLADEGRLAGVRPGHDDAAEAGLPGHESDGQSAAHRLEAPVKGQLADEEIFAQARRRDDFEKGEKSEGDRQVEGRSPLSPVGRRQVDGDALGLQVVAAVLEGRPDPLLALPYGGVRQAHRDEGREAGADVDFDLDGVGFDPVERGARDLVQHGAR